jgi:hypothetical protein
MTPEKFEGDAMIVGLPPRIIPERFYGGVVEIHCVGHSIQRLRSFRGAV